MEHFFSPNSSRDLRSDAHQSQIIGGDTNEDHTQIVGGDTVKLLGGFIPPFPPGFGTPDGTSKFWHMMYLSHIFTYFENFISLI